MILQNIKEKHRPGVEEERNRKWLFYKGNL
jgi:hypothetical protein